MHVAFDVATASTDAVNAIAVAKQATARHAILSAKVQLAIDHSHAAHGDANELTPRARGHVHGELAIRAAVRRQLDHQHLGRGHDKHVEILFVDQPAHQRRKHRLDLGRGADLLVLAVLAGDQSGHGHQTQLGHDHHVTTKRCEVHAMARHRANVPDALDLERGGAGGVCALPHRHVALGANGHQVVVDRQPGVHGPVDQR